VGQKLGSNKGLSIFHHISSNHCDLNLFMVLINTFCFLA
jgi:hypothetical protein